jgi:hypothetical protein
MVGVGNLGNVLVVKFQCAPVDQVAQVAGVNEEDFVVVVT